MVFWAAASFCVANTLPRRHSRSANFLFVVRCGSRPWESMTVSCVDVCSNLSYARIKVTKQSN